MTRDIYRYTGIAKCPNFLVAANGRHYSRSPAGYAKEKEMKLHVALLTLTLALAGPLVAEEQAENVNSDQLAVCTQSAEENGLQGEELQNFMSDCMGTDSKTDSKKESDA